MRSKAGGDRLSFIDFQLPTLVDDPPEGDDWIHEIKYDGYRTAARHPARRGARLHAARHRLEREVSAHRRSRERTAGQVRDHRRRGDCHERSRPIGFRQAALGDPLAARPHHLRRLRSDASRRQGSAATPDDRAQGRAGASCSAAPSTAPSNSANTSRAAAGILSRSAKAWGSRAWSRSGPARPIAAAAPKAG